MYGIQISLKKKKGKKEKKGGRENGGNGEMRGKNEEKGGKETKQNLPFYLIVHQHEVVNDMYENKLCDFHE